MKTIKNIIGILGLFTLVALLLSGPISLIICIITKNMLFLDAFLVYGVVALTAFYSNELAKWADSIKKK